MNLVIGGGHDNFPQSSCWEVFAVEFSTAVTVEVPHCSIGHKDEDGDKIDSAKESSHDKCSRDEDRVINN